jgi:hypothetical protein
MKFEPKSHSQMQLKLQICSNLISYHNMGMAYILGVASNTY